jgi:hypothetical protein
MDVDRFRELLKRGRAEKMVPHPDTEEELGYDENYDSGENFVRNKNSFLFKRKKF